MKEIQQELQLIGKDLIANTFPHLFPSLNNILYLEVNQKTLKISNSEIEVIFEVTYYQRNGHSQEFKLIAPPSSKPSNEILQVNVEVLSDQTLNYLDKPPYQELVKIFEVTP